MKTIAYMLAVLFALSVTAVRADVDMSSKSYDFDDYTFAQKDSLTDTVKEELKALDAASEEVREAAAPDKSDETIAKITALQSKKDVAHTTFDVLEDVDSLDAWNKSRDRMEAALEDYRRAYDVALDRVRDEQKLIQ